MSAGATIQTQAATRPTITPAVHGLLQRCTATQECAECRKKRLSALQRAAVDTSPVNEVPPIVHEVLRTPGQPLDAQTRTFMEPRFGHDFSKVRVHTDSKAAESARFVNARAYTVGRNVVFGEGQYVPRTQAGKRLLMHELTHTIQQGFDSSRPEQALQIGPPDSVDERIADVHAQLNEDDVPLTEERRNSSKKVLQRQKKAPIEREQSETHNLQVDPNLFRFSLDVLRGQHHFGAEVSLTNPVSIPLDLLGINSRVDSSHLQAILSYGDRCNRAFQSALIDLEAGPFISVNRVPWQITSRVGVRFGNLRFEPGIGLGFEGSDFNSVLFTLNLAAASPKILPECIAPPSPKPVHEPRQPTSTKTPRRDETPHPHHPQLTFPTTTSLPSYTLHFFYDSTLMRPEDHNDFQHVVDLLQNVPSLHVQIIGHTSLEGSEAYNQRLSEQRAGAVRDWLVLAGINSSRIQTFGMGESAPAVTEPNIPRRSLLPSIERVRTLNRRVEITFFDPSGRFGPKFPPFTLHKPGRALSPFSLGVPKFELGR